MENTCQKIQEEIPELITGSLPDEKAAELYHHIEKCPACSEYLQKLQADDKLLGNFAEAMQPTVARLENNVMDALKHRPIDKTIHTIAIWKTIMKSKITKLAAAAVVIIAVLIGAHQFGSSIESVAWADVAERFRSVTFFNATFYFKDDATAQPEQVELWMNQLGQGRLRTGNQIIFAHNGKITKAFDLETRSEIEPDSRTAALVDLIGQAESFSLETVIRSIPGGELVDATGLINTDAVISEDLVVFDIESPNSTQWYRIWALRASKLPVRIRMWDPSDGASVDILFTYSKQQQEIFFDPEAFSTKMKSLPDKEINLAYMYLKDPGGKQI